MKVIGGDFYSEKGYLVIIESFICYQYQIEKTNSTSFKTLFAHKIVLLSYVRVRSKDPKCSSEESMAQKGYVY